MSNELELKRFGIEKLPDPPENVTLVKNASCNGNADLGYFFVKIGSCKKFVHQSEAGAKKFLEMMLQGEGEEYLVSNGIQATLHVISCRQDWIGRDGRTVAFLRAMLGYEMIDIRQVSVV